MPIKEMPQISKKGIIVCADDFGLSRAVNKGVVRLLESSRISAVSCLVTGSAWQEGYPKLLHHQSDADIGLHLVFNNYKFGKIVRYSLLRKIDKNAILDSFRQQFNRFCHDMKRNPDFIDGHEHIHQLPLFRRALLELIEGAGESRIYIRNSSLALSGIFNARVSIVKNLLISSAGTSLKRLLNEHGLKTNDSLLGLYNFKSRAAFKDIFKRFIRIAKPWNTVFLVHPADDGAQETDADDQHSQRRMEELSYLMSDDYIKELERLGFSLTRFNH